MTLLCHHYNLILNFTSQTSQRHAALVRERHASLMLLVMTVTFNVAWLPYTVISLLSMVGTEVRSPVRFFIYIIGCCKTVKKLSSTEPI